ncbi:DUF3995 domain-containing protein [Streptomyces sp. NPDC053792]|uniref:DUF3995 domain-containing protein n=1 Tax=unclassified Streptomyces TaxID=2593676 RepID=UPI00344A1735
MWHEVVGAISAVALAAIGVLHVVWGFSPWPARDRDELASFVYSGPGMPSRTPCLAVGGALLIAAYGVLAVADIWPQVGPHWLYRVGIWVLTSALLLRGIAGPLLSKGAGREFARWNLIAYSPLCAVLGLCALVVAQ